MVGTVVLVEYLRGDEARDFIKNTIGLNACPSKTVVGGVVGERGKRGVGTHNCESKRVCKKLSLSKGAGCEKIQYLGSVPGARCIDSDWAGFDASDIRSQWGATAASACSRHGDHG